MLQAPGQPYAFDDPSQDEAFPEQAQVAQLAQQVQSQFDESRQRHNYIEAVAKGGSPRRGAMRQSVTG